MQTYQIRLRELREDHDKTQKEIADLLGIEQTVYSRYETGRNEMKIFHLISLCEYYGVSADYILGLPKGLPYGLSKTK
jgi:transcriptional regulator with XRE-family HTH domain